MELRRATLFLALLCVATLAPPVASSADADIRIAAIFALTGPARQANASSLEGARLAVHELNQRGGVLGQRLEMVEIDNRSTPIGAKVAADKAARMGVTAIVGSMWSSHSLAVAPVAQAHGIPMVTNASTHPDVTRSRDYVFRVCFTDDFQGRVMARFAAENLGARSALIFRDVTSDYSLELAREFKAGFEGLGGKVFGVVDYKRTQDAFRDTMQGARGLDAEVIFIPGYDESGTLIRNALEAGIDGVFLGGDGWVTDGFLERGGRLLERGYYCTHYDDQMETDAYLTFLEKVRVFMGEVSWPLPASPLSYDAVMLIADALERAGSSDRAALRKALADTPGFEGVSGTIRFDEQGDPVKDAVIMQISNGSRRFFKTISPASEP